MLAAPTHLLTITAVGPDWATTTRQMARIVRRLRDLGDVQAIAWHVEFNTHLDGAHVHCWYRGADLDVEVLAATSVSAGCGRVVDVSPILDASGWGMSYGMKAIASSLDLPIPVALAEQAAYRRLNGFHRLVHPTLGFWLDHDGRRISQDEALTIVSTRRSVAKS